MERDEQDAIGVAGGEGRRPYAGETLRLAEQVRADVGSLAILWTSADSFLATPEAGGRLVAASAAAVIEDYAAFMKEA